MGWPLAVRGFFMHSTKSRCATRRVWRMTAENQLGEILQLPDQSNAGRNRQGSRSRRHLSEPATAPASFHVSTGFASRSTGEPGDPASGTMSSAMPSSWRASSYDLLQGLTVRDVSEKIPQRMFEALFSADVASSKRG